MVNNNYYYDPVLGLQYENRNQSLGYSNKTRAVLSRNAKRAQHGDERFATKIKKTLQ